MVKPVKRLTENKIVLVVRPSRIDELIRRYNTVEQAAFCVRQSGADFDDYIEEDRTYKTAVAATESLLSMLGRLQTVDRSFLPNFIFGKDDTVVALGQDGLAANTLKYLSTQPLLGVNPDPARYDGVLLPFEVRDLAEAVATVFAGRARLQIVRMGEVRLSDGRRLLAVNDFFVGMRTHVSARYEICHGEHRERQSSSGIIVSTGLGATGWLKSVLAGAAGIARAMGKTASFPDDYCRTTPDASHLYFSVREPFPSRVTGTDIVFGKIEQKTPLVVTSAMAENGVIFSDGMEDDFLAFNSGTVATIGLAETVGQLVQP